MDHVLFLFLGYIFPKIRIPKTEGYNVENWIEISQDYEELDKNG